jgi:malonyl-CoA O-methyltransferase
MVSGPAAARKREGRNVRPPAMSPGEEDAALAVDVRRLRRARARHADSFSDAARVPHDLADRLMEHLAPIRRTPARALDLGAGDGCLTRALERRYRGCAVIALDPCLPMLAVGRRRLYQRLLASEHRLCAEPAALPLASASVDLVCSHLALSGHGDLDAVLRESRRVLRHDGVIMLSVLGPDSLRELRQAWADLDGHHHVHGFADMHDVGDALVRAGFCDVVVDVERLTVEFRDFRRLLEEVRVAGGGNAARGRARGLTTPRRLQRLRERLQHANSGRDDTLTLEAVFAHAWAVDGPAMEVAPPRRAR